MPKKPCAHPGCSRLIEVGTSLCEQHQRQEKQLRDKAADGKRAKAEYRKWYKKAAWCGPKGRRRRQLDAQPLCEMCPPNSRQLATVADHKEPHRGDYALFWFGKLQSLCKCCHDIKKQRMERRAASLGGMKSSKAPR